MALCLAYDIIDRIHAKRYSCTQASASRPATSCFGSGACCTPLQPATADLWNWHQLVAAQRAGGEAVARNDSTPGDAPVLAVRVGWDDRVANRRAGSNASADSSCTCRRLYLRFRP